MVNRWRMKNEVIFHESEILREKQYEIGNFRSGQDYVIQVFLKRTTFSDSICLKVFGTTNVQVVALVEEKIGGHNDVFQR